MKLLGDLETFTMARRDEARDDVRDHRRSGTADTLLGAAAEFRLARLQLALEFVRSLRRR